MKRLTFRGCATHSLFMDISENVKRLSFGELGNYTYILFIAWHIEANSKTDKDLTHSLLLIWYD